MSQIALHWRKFDIIILQCVVNIAPVTCHFVPDYIFWATNLGVGSLTLRTWGVPLGRSLSIYSLHPVETSGRMNASLFLCAYLRWLPSHQYLGDQFFLSIQLFKVIHIYNFISCKGTTNSTILKQWLIFRKMWEGWIGHWRKK